MVQREWLPAQRQSRVYVKMSKLVINTAQSLYKPIEIKIDGKTYTVKAKFSRKFLNKLGEYDKKITAGDTDAPFERLEKLIGKQAVIDKLDLREVNEITEHIIEKIKNPEKDLPEIEKNVTGPGDKK